MSAATIHPADLRARLRDRTETLAKTLLGEPNRAHSSRRELRWGSNGSLALQLCGEKQGLWFDHERGVGGDLLDLIRDVRRCDFHAAAAWAMGQVQGEPTPRPSRQPPHDRATSASSYAARIAAEMHGVTGTLAERYLRETRGMGDLPLPAEIGFHPAVWSRETRSTHPALIVPCVEDGRIVRVQAVLLVLAPV
jgi:hypothetical protein